MTSTLNTESIRASIPSSANERAAAAGVLRRAQLQGVANWVRKAADERLDKLEGELESDVLSKLPDHAKLFAAAESRISNAFAQLEKDVVVKLKALAGIVADKAEDGAKEHHGLDAGAAVSPEKAVASPVLGATVEEHFEKMAADALFRFKAAVRTGLAAGETPQQISERLNGERAVAKAVECELSRRVGVIRAADPDISVRLLDAALDSVSKVIEAAVSQVANLVESSLEVEDEDEDSRRGWQWVATLDANTCERCEFYDGSRWDADFEPVGDAPEFPEDPPLHFNCRCAIVPSDLDGEAAPPKDFDDYLAGYSRSEQEAAFGKEALRAYRRGDITPAQLVGDRDHTLSLEEFKDL